MRRLMALVLMVVAGGLLSSAPARAQAPGLSLLLSVNQSVFGPATTLEVTLGLEYAGPPIQVDLLFGAILPDGDSIVFLEGAAPSPSTGRLGQLASLRPLLPGLVIGSGLTAVVPDFFRYTWQGTEPLGTYRLFFAATRPGALRDGRLDGGDLIAVETVTLTLLPPASVSVDPAQSATAQVSTEGGTLAATAADGTTYTLSVPAGALAGPTTITLTPVTTVTGLPPGLTLLAAVRAEPDGLTLAVPATLTVAPPGGSVPASVIGLVTSSTGAGLELLPAFPTTTGELLVANVAHFSVVGAALPASRADLASLFGFAGIHALLAATPPDEAAIGAALLTYFNSVIRPLLVSGQTDLNALLHGMNEFFGWDFERLTRAGPTTEPLRALSLTGKQFIADGLRAAVARLNAECVVAPELSLVRAEDVLRLQALAESYFQLLTGAFLVPSLFSAPPEPLFGGLGGLDLASVVEDLCVRVDILAVDFPADPDPGVPAVLTVQAGLVFTGGPAAPFFGLPLDVDVDAVGASPAVRVGQTGAEGRFTTTFTPATTAVTLRIVATFRPTGFPYLRRAELSATETVGGVGGVIVSPSQTTIAPGESRQFTATVEGTTNQAVTWAVSGGGSITQTGLFTSNGTLGTFFVTATSVADPSSVGIAQVTVQAETSRCLFSLNVIPSDGQDQGLFVERESVTLPVSVSVPGVTAEAGFGVASVSTTAQFARGRASFGIQDARGNFYPGRLRITGSAGARDYEFRIESTGVFGSQGRVQNGIVVSGQPLPSSLDVPDAVSAVSIFVDRFSPGGMSPGTVSLSVTFEFDSTPPACGGLRPN